MICADKVAKEVQENPKTLKEIRKAFGDEIFDSNGTLNRDKLGDIIFNDRTQRNKLNAIMKPKVMWALLKKLWHMRYTEGQDLIVMDIPLLFEAGIFKYLMFPIICVAVPDEKISMQRLMNRNGLTQKQAAQRIAAQMPISEKIKMSDIVINNSGSIT